MEWKENKMSYTYFLQPITDIHLKSNLRYDSQNNGSLARVRIFAIIGIIVLLLACINYINLTTAGASKRAKEVGVRKVAGSDRFQLIRQFLAESMMVAMLALIIAFVLVQLALPAFNNISGKHLSLDVKPIIGGVWPITQWHEAFEKMHKGEVVKSVLKPV